MTPGDLLIINEDAPLLGLGEHGQIIDESHSDTVGIYISTEDATEWVSVGDRAEFFHYHAVLVGGCVVSVHNNHILPFRQGETQ